MTSSRAPAPDRTRQGLALMAWLLLLAGYWWYTSANGLTPVETMRTLVAHVSGSPYGLAIYVLAYVIRPVFLFPATLLTMTATYLYGPWRGISYALIASNLSTLVAYWIGRFFASGFLRDLERHPLVGRYAGRLRQDSFQTTLILRFLFVPYDLVSYFSGVLNIDLRGFMAATVLGSIPGTISFGLLGASIQGDFAAQSLTLDPLSLLAALAMFAVSLGLYRLVRRRERSDTPRA